MKNLFAKARKRWERDRDLPYSKRVLDLVALGAQSVNGAVFSTQCDRAGFGIRVIGGRPVVTNRGRLEIGSMAVIRCQVAPVALVTQERGTIQIGDEAAINFGTLISAGERVKIGKRVGIGPYCVLSDTDTSIEGSPSFKAIELGDDVWLAAKVTVLPGSRIGSGTVVTAGSIVDGELPPGVVAGGVPARVLRKIAAPATASETAAAEGAPVPQPPAACSTEALQGTNAEDTRPPKHVVYLISDFTIDELGRRLADDPAEPKVASVVAPFGQVVPSLLQAAPEGADCAVVWTRPDAIVPSFGRVEAFEEVPEAELLAEVDQFADLILNAAGRYRAVFVPTWIASSARRLGFVDSRPGGVARSLAAMNLRLMTRLESAPNVFVLNAQHWLDAVGRGAVSPKLWYMGKVPFHGGVFDHATSDIKAALAGMSGNARKLLVLDLDDTLWGGIVGDMGWENLRLGGHDSVGESFVDFQRAIKNLKRRGIILAIASKNDESVALEAIRTHPEMVLREEDFVAWQINWSDKAQNIATLTKNLNLGLQSVVFIDDNPVERARVRETLPEVLVPEWPADKLLYTTALHQLRCFDSQGVSKEDLERTLMYQSERNRESLKVDVGSIQEWLKSLKIVVKSSNLAPVNLARTVQLLNKTNQLNLSTRRLTEPELLDWTSDADNRVLRVINVSDRFGDSGLTGIVSVERDGQVARVVDFVLSCRVMGRCVEETLVHVAVQAAKQLGCSALEATHLPTAKNRPCLEFFQRSGLEARDGGVFHWDLATPYACPEVIQLENAS